MNGRVLIYNKPLDYTSSLWCELEVEKFWFYIFVCHSELIFGFSSLIQLKVLNF